MIRNFPSKRVFVVAFVAIGFLVWTIWNVTSLSNSSALDENILASVSEAGSSFPDEDNDGLADWEEGLFGTNPASTDSDNNGISDEKQYRSVQSTLIIKPTDSVYNYLSQLGSAIANGPQDIEIPEGNLNFKPDYYKASDLLFLNTPDKKDIETYTISILTLLMNDYQEVMNAQMLDVINNWFETKNVNNLENISKQARALKALSKELASLAIPIQFISVHLNLINTLYHEAETLNEIKIASTNHVQGFLVAAQYTDYRSKRSKAIVELTGQFNKVTAYQN